MLLHVTNCRSSYLHLELTFDTHRIENILKEVGYDHVI
jgi:hypothetical protein